MQFPFEGDMGFGSVDEELPRATDVLRVCPWRLQPYNAPYLAGKAPEPSHTYGPLGADPQLPHDWSEADTLAVVGDISHELPVGTDFIIARTSDFKRAGELADKMGYRPTLAGEFLQLLWWLRRQEIEESGWFFCYMGRTAGYAVLADYERHHQINNLSVTFDTHIGNQIEEGYMSSNRDTYCFFVRVP